MKLRRERTLLQAAVAAACIIPIGAACTGIALGAEWLQPDPATDMDSHFRYLSGLFLVLGLAFVTCIPGIERKGGRFRLLAAMVIVGGLSRLLSLSEAGMPSPGHMTGLAIELIVVPLLLGWQTRIAHLYRQRPDTPSATAAVQP